MATQATQKGIANSWSLISFARSHGRMQVAPFVNKGTGEAFKSCVFTDDEGTRTFVSFSSNMGELSPREIARQKAELQVVELNSGSFILCRQGEDTWEDVDLGF